MLIVRAARGTDLPALTALAQGAGIGLTTLSKDPEVLRNRLDEARHAFRPGVRKPAGESYFFVLEDLLTGQLAGCCGIVALVGGYEPFYCYDIETTLKTSKQLGISKEVRALHLVADHKGPSEIGTLFLHASQRGQGAGRLLSLARFAFMAAFPERFADEVIAEMRGVVDGEGRSPFWEAIGRHFFAVDFAEADARSGHDKQFIADLMPDHPIYIPMLPTGAQAVIGEVHREARPALRLLEQEGFRFDHRVDIFDGGPLIKAERAAIRTIRETRTSTLAAVLPAGAEGGTHLISTPRLDFRACLGTVTEADTGVAVPRDVALALDLKLGDRLAWSPLR